VNWSSRRKKLTPLQVQVVQYCAEQKCHPMDAVKAGKVSESSVDKWRVAEVQKWVQEYRAAFPTAQETAERVKAELAAMANQSLRVMRDNLTQGEGDATAFRTAKYIIDGIIADAQTQQVAEDRPHNDEAELAAVLRLVK